MGGSLAAGAVVAGRYRLDAPLGEGGMGAVWAATHTVTLRRCALKFLKGPAHLRPELRRRFLREARAAAAVDHPSVVGVHDVFEMDDETPVMVMDLLEGETLGRRIAREQALPLPDVAGLLVPVASAVGTAHALGIVHRDLKPDNIFLVGGQEGAPSVRVLDFGIAKLTAVEGAAVETGILTGTGTMLGTPCYMAPEQGFGEKDIDHRADLWAFGVILYECLAGARPVEGDNLGQVLKRLMQDGITPIEAVVPDLPADVAELVGSLLSREREERPADLREVLAVLERYTDVRAPAIGAPASLRETVEPLSDAIVVGGGPVDTGGDTEAAPSEPGRPETGGPMSVSVAARRARGRIAAALAVAAVGAGIAVALAVGGGGDPADPAERSAAARSAAAQSAAEPTGASAAGQPAAELTPPVAEPPAPAPVAAESPAPVEEEGAEEDEPAPAAPPASAAQVKDDAPAVAPSPVRRRRAVNAPPPPVAKPAPPPAPAASPASRPASGGLVDEPPF